MTRPEEPLRPLQLIATLQSHCVDFVVIGGYSLAAHGHVRGTKDVDISAEPSPANIVRLWRALQDLDAEPLITDDFDPRELPVPFDADGLSQGGNCVLRTRFGRLDVMQSVKGMSSYARLSGGAVAVELADVPEPVAFAGYDDLIAMKQAAGREEDLRDIAALERARGA